MDQHLNHLAIYGYAVIPFIPTDEVQSTRDRFLKTGRAFPEYKDMEDQFQFVAGGLASLRSAIRPVSIIPSYVRCGRRRSRNTVSSSKVQG